MTVAELIAILNEFNSDAAVEVSADSSGIELVLKCEMGHWHTIKFIGLRPKK